MRDVNNLAFLHRERTRFDAGASELLGVALEPVGGATNFAVDVRELPSCARSPSRRTGAR